MGIGSTAITSMAGLRLSHSMQLHGALSSRIGGGVAKLLCMLNFVKNMFCMLILIFFYLYYHFPNSHI